MRINTLAERDFFVCSGVRESLNRQTVQELKGLAQWLNLSLSSKLRKEGIVDQLYHFFMDDVTVWIRRLPQYEVKLLRSLASSGDACSTEEYNFFASTCLEDLCLVLSEYSEKEDLKMNFVISKELKQALKNVDWDALLEDPAQQRKYEMERYAYGLLNLYGVLLMKDTFETVAELMDQKLTMDEILDLFEESLGLRNLIYILPQQPGKKDIWLRSFYMDDPEDILSHLSNNIQTMDTAAYSQEEIAAAGSMPWMDFSQWITPDLKYWMVDKMKYSEEEMRSVLLYLWFSNQYECNLSSLLATAVNARLDNSSDMKKAMELLIRFLNETPKWILLGNSSEEISRQEAVARQPYVAQPKVGRNDPCPCGSGKKYKQCCGRKN